MRQASGMDKLKIEKVQATTLRKCRHFGTDPTEWTDEQQEEFATLLDEAGAAFKTKLQLGFPSVFLMSMLM